MGILEKIAEIEAEMARTQKNKATEYHLGTLKAKLAKYRAQLLEPTGKGAKGEGFDVMKSGDARVALIGFPSVGKATLLSTITKTESECASYEFTTLTCIPGVIEHNGSRIQLLDLPGIIEGAAQGKGRGRQVIAVARTADLVLMMLDATKGDKQRELLTYELESVGIRLNKRRPNVYFKKKTTGGVKFTATVPLTKINERTVNCVLHEYKLFNCELLIREDITLDELVDVIDGSRVYLNCLYCYNKIDIVSLEEVDRIAREPHQFKMGILEKIAEIEAEMARTQKNKATEYHLGTLKAKLAKYRAQLLEPTGKGAKGEGFDVMKSGDARVALIGFPSVGKSTLLSTITKTESECASYEFTTLTCIPGVIEHNGSRIQLLDLPGIIEGAAQGKGRGRQVIAVARTADLVLMMLDATKGDKQRELLTYELESVGIRLNKRRPNVYFKKKTTGGVKFTATVPLTKINERTVNCVLHEYKLFNCELLISLLYVSKLPLLLQQD
eukprot:sb/3464071/